MNITVPIKEDLTVDLRTLASGCQIDHASAMRLLIKYREQLERFGILRFDIREITGRGQPMKVAYLNEDQATLFVTFCKNTDKVVEFKCALVAAYKEAKQKLAAGSFSPAQIKSWVMEDFYNRARPVQEHGSEAKDGRPRIGFRRSTFTVARGRLDDATMVAADIYQLANPQLPLFAENALHS